MASGPRLTKGRGVASIPKHAEQPAKFTADCATNLLSDDVFCDLPSPIPGRSAKPQAGFFQHSHGSNVLRHHQANDAFERQISKPETNRGDRGFGGKPKPPLSTHQTETDLDLTEFFQIFKTGKADMIAGAFEYAGPASESVFPVIRHRVSKQDFPRVFDIEQALIAGETQYLWVAIQPEQRLSVSFDILPQE